jgi:glycosyltransferase involved in cell wall biosynthesis
VSTDGGHAVFLVPGDPQARTGGTLYDQRIAAGLRASGWVVDWRSPGDGFPLADAATMGQAQRTVEALPDGALVVADGLAFSVLPELAARHAQRLRWVALVHHPLALETGLTPAQQAALRESERRALASARHVIVTSPATARALAEYAVPAARISVVEPGTDPAPMARGGGAGAGALSLLCVASVTARKGHVELLQALAGLRDRPWQLHCAGSLQHDAATASAVRDAAAQLGLAERIAWHGEVDAARLAALYDAADVFVLASHHEGYGMAFAEALAHGLPVVGCAAGAVADTVPADAGRLVPVGDAPALQQALRGLMDDMAARQSLAAGARAAALRLPRWDDAAQRFATALAGVAP